MAQAVNLLFFLPTAAAGLVIHGRKGYLDKPTWVQAALPGTLAALAGALVALRLDVSLLKKPFGIFLLYTGGMMLWSVRRKKPSQGESSTEDFSNSSK